MPSPRYGIVDGLVAEIGQPVVLHHDRHTWVAVVSENAVEHLDDHPDEDKRRMTGPYELLARFGGPDLREALGLEPIRRRRETGPVAGESLHEHRCEAAAILLRRLWPWAARFRASHLANDQPKDWWYEMFCAGDAVPAPAPEPPFACMAEKSFRVVLAPASPQGGGPAAARDHQQVHTVVYRGRHQTAATKDDIAGLKPPEGGPIP